MREQPDQRLERAAARAGSAWRESSRKSNATWPATKNAIVVNSATGQLRNVPAKTPMAVSTIAWSRPPKSPLNAGEDVYLARAVGRSNAKDQRLLALGEVRDLTPGRDDEGRIVALPSSSA